MDPVWSERLRQWKSYNAWERDHMGEEPVPFGTALAWMWAARQLAARFNPDWLGHEDLDERVTRLARIREGLAVLSPPT